MLSWYLGIHLEEHGRTFVHFWLEKRKKHSLLNRKSQRSCGPVIVSGISVTLNQEPTKRIPPLYENYLLKSRLYLQFSWVTTACSVLKLVL